MIPKEVFLSHSSKNKVPAKDLAETIRNHGVPVWYSPTNIKSAQRWHDEIGKALRRCDWFLVLISRDSVCSRWVRMELAYALNHNQYDNHILPIKLEVCDHEQLSWTLEIFQMVEFDGSSDEAYAQILDAWGLTFDPSHRP
ncbi:MAG TPA: toll/interleukin-1 receptor domain-containing protein [Anaerolineales bacterium]|nr:toll/interleukin-1 receptor domain-containing protein [Anaerolineales bacterium]